MQQDLWIILTKPGHDFRNKTSNELINLLITFECYLLLHLAEGRHLWRIINTSHQANVYIMLVWLCCSKNLNHTWSRYITAEMTYLYNKMLLMLHMLALCVLAKKKKGKNVIEVGSTSFSNSSSQLSVYHCEGKHPPRGFKLRCCFHKYVQKWFYTLKLCSLAAVSLKLMFA